MSAARKGPIGLERRLVSIFADPSAALDEDDFRTLALEIYARQYEAGDFYRDFCQRRGVRPEDVVDWRDIPAVPTAAFKETHIGTFPVEDAAEIFLSSRTTGNLPSRHALRRPELYHAALLENFRLHVVPRTNRPTFVLLFPSLEELPDSSLGHMLDFVARNLSGAPGHTVVRDGTLDTDAFETAVERLAGPACLLGTTYSFLHLFEHLDRSDRQLRLPDGSGAMETGGLKGRAPGQSRDRYLDGFRRCLGIDPDRVVGEYGMTELSSQFYEDHHRRGSARADPSGPPVFVGPPWTRTRVIDPATGFEVESGAGVLVHYDLANVDSVMAVQTDDLGSPVPGGFELWGRVPGAEARGCSFAVKAERG